ncbi:MAG: putative acetyltransferase [Gemmatimonadetes bacterium]|nr:putative acetyltransferase [Gemmatimonadota bacterium]
MTVLDLRQRPASEWAPRFTDLLFSENEWLTALDPAAARGATRRLVDSLLNDKGAALIGHTNNGQLDAAAAVGPSHWDSAHFGIEVFRLHAFSLAPDVEEPARLAEAFARDGLVPRLASADMVMARVSMNAVRELNALEAAGFRTMDVQVTWMRRRQEHPSSAPDHSIRTATLADAESLSVLAREAMRKAPTHFHVDHRLAAGRVDALYDRWAANSVNGGAAADHVVVCVLDGEIAGFTTARIAGASSPDPEQYGTIPLVAVSSRFRGRRVGQRLVSAALTWLDGQGLSASCVGTQANNFRAAHLYAELGFRPVHAAASMHRWSDAVGGS